VDPDTLYHVSYWARAEPQVDGVPVSGRLAQPRVQLFGWGQAKPAATFDLKGSSRGSAPSLSFAAGSFEAQATATGGIQQNSKGLGATEHANFIESGEVLSLDFGRDTVELVTFELWFQDGGLADPFTLTVGGQPVSYEASIETSGAEFQTFSVAGNPRGKLIEITGGPESAFRVSGITVRSSPVLRRGLRSVRNPSASGAWTEYHGLVNSGDNTELEIILTTGLGARGTVWFDDLGIEEVAFVHLVRGSGGPVWVRSVDGSIAYVEGVDFDPLVDPIVENGPAGRPRGEFDVYHPPPVMTIPPTSALASGEEFLIDYYTVVPLDLGKHPQVAATLCGAEIEAWMEANLDTVHTQLAGVPGYFLVYDEIRQLNTSANCKAMHLHAGGVLASHIQMATSLVRALEPRPEVYIWSDMFDPFHNARDNYYQVDETLVGSWEGLPSETIIVNWGMTRSHPDGTKADLVDSIRWFAGRGHRQILAGYYDSGNGAEAANLWLDKAQAANVNGVIGLMYTAWAGTPEQLFSELESFAEAALDHPFVTGEAP
jgi:hypothetical protein